MSASRAAARVKFEEKKPKFDEKRLVVLRAAARVFSTLGFHRASLGDISRELNMTAPALYYYVKSKDQLLYECSEIALSDLQASLERAQSESSGLEGVRSFFRSYAELICDDFGRCLALHKPTDLPSEMQEPSKVGRRVLDHSVRELVVQGVTDGSVRPCDPKFVTAMLFASLNALASGPRLTSREAVKRANAYLDIVVNGIGTDASEQGASDSPSRPVRAARDTAKARAPRRAAP